MPNTKPKPAPTPKVHPEMVKARKWASKADPWPLIYRYLSGIDASYPAGKGGFTAKHQAAIDEILRRMACHGKLKALAQSMGVLIHEAESRAGVPKKVIREAREAVERYTRAI